MLSSALISLGVAGSALAWPNLGRSQHSSIARAIHARQEPAVVKAKEPVAATWFASWHADEFSLANVSWNKYTTVSYSFALTTPNISFVNISDPEVFKDFVSTAHANNVSATISIGGWTGSLYFSSAVATAENRTEFVKTMVSLLEDNNLDGLSFDWEYPNAAGIGCNTKSPNDTENFLLFLKELRTALPNATLSAATAITPFLSADGTPSTNVSDAIEAWTKAGFPADQLVLGIGAYGHGFSVAPANALNNSILNPYSTFNKSFTPPGDAWDDAPVNGTLDVCGNPKVQGGTWNFWGLIEGGFLNENGTANTAEGIAYKYDECSQTPFVYNQTSGVLVAFDNAASFAAKGQFINATGLRGFAMWEAGGDYDDILLDAIRSGAGFPAVVEDDDGDYCEDDETSTTTPETSTSGSTSATRPITRVAAARLVTRAALRLTIRQATLRPAALQTLLQTAEVTSYVSPAATSSTSAAQPVTTSEASLPDEDEDDEEECEDDETIAEATTSVATSGTVSATSTATASVVSTGPVTTSQATATSTPSTNSHVSESSYETTSASGTGSIVASSSPSTSASVVETSSIAQPTASENAVPTSVVTKSYEPSSTYATVEPTTSVHSSSNAEPSSSSAQPTTVQPSSAEPSSAEPTKAAPSSSAQPTTSSGPASFFEPAPTSTVPTTSAPSLSSVPTTSATYTY
ncbi:unnamed protein product [Rhizoctonia solani]|uniref:GH18 domain-containing protein n=1 Tax=Rhizoctonia solani TaxID=456999 RepID=A0A8H3ADB9_9AGAM|nr:unnamed protein product [Rhizoctonia solani]